MYFDGYTNHTDAKINPSLLWEYDLSRIDYQQMKSIVIQRVIELGWPNDWYAMLNLYGESTVKETIKSLAYLNDKDMNFVSLIFEIPLTDLKCYKRKQSQPIHWNS